MNSMLKFDCLHEYVRETTQGATLLKAFKDFCKDLHEKLWILSGDIESIMVHVTNLIDGRC